MGLPFISRLQWEDYKRLFIAITILIIESVLRLFTWLIPFSFFDFLRLRLLQKTFPRVFRGFHDKEDIIELCNPLDDIIDTPNLIRYHGFDCEEHIVLTSDGYYLSLHRIVCRPNIEPNHNSTDFSSFSPSRTQSISNLLPPSARGPPVLFIHGAMMNSEGWVCNPSTMNNLAFQLTSNGYDVWLANRRGNKYSHKHIYYKPYEKKFWDFSLDETIQHDIPANVEYILAHINAIGREQYKSITLIGFSQGTAEILASLSILPRLAKRINCVVALSATTKPAGLTNSIVRSMINWTPELIFLIFGRKAMISSVYFWSAVLSPRANVWYLDLAMNILFNWKNQHIRSIDKPYLYRHLYSTTSVKQIVHWFQIIRSGKFQMFDDLGGPTHIGIGMMDRHNRVPEYPIKTVNVPMMVICGGKDTLIDITYLQNTLPHASFLTIPTYEHMDMLWAHSTREKVYLPICDFISLYAFPFGNNTNSPNLIPSYGLLTSGKGSKAEFSDDSSINSSLLSTPNNKRRQIKRKSVQ